jgi:hypothetical protein
MSDGGFSDERLREALTEVAEAVREGRDCPDAERIWLSARRELGPSENESILLHVARCAACSLAWRVAQDLGDRAAGVGLEPAPRGGASRLRYGLAAAALVVAAVGLGIVFRPGPADEPETVYRTQEGTWLRSTLEEGVPLPREELVLHWTPGPEGTIYDVLVTSETLEPLAGAASLEAAEFRVDAESLEGLPAGSRVLWQVTARLPDGRTVESEAYAAEVE